MNNKNIRCEVYLSIYNIKIKIINMSNKIKIKLPIRPIVSNVDLIMYNVTKRILGE